MAYDHTDKVGNQGDVVKHAVLARLLSKIISESQGARFVYAESHTGRPDYVLPAGGEWEQGIKILTEKLSKINPFPEPLRDYFEIVLKGGVDVGNRYLGSSGLAFSFALQNQKSFRFILHETDGPAWGDLVRYFHPWPDVAVIQDDGYSGILGLAQADFVLIDPPNLDNPKDIIKLMTHIVSKKIPFMCWTPRIGIRKAPSAEAKKYLNFREKVDRDLLIKPILIQWRKWGSRTCGCTLHVSPKENYRLANSIVDKLLIAFPEWRKG